jgi:hypothetical protein
VVRVDGPARRSTMHVSAGALDLAPAWLLAPVGETAMVPPSAAGIKSAAQRLLTGIDFVAKRAFRPQTRLQRPILIAPSNRSGSEWVPTMAIVRKRSLSAITPSRRWLPADVFGPKPESGRPYGVMLTPSQWMPLKTALGDLRRDNISSVPTPWNAIIPGGRGASEAAARRARARPIGCRPRAGRAPGGVLRARR